MDDNTQLRENLISQADASFMVLAEHVNDLLDSAQYFSDSNPHRSKSDRVKLEGLNTAVKDLGQLIKQLSSEIERWKKEEDRVLSKLGVELQFLNELYATIEATMLFLIREDVRLNNFSLGAVKQAYTELIRCNKLL